jgi:hypothetical protein
MAELVFCAECAYFIRDKVGDGSGIGRCKVYQYHKKNGYTTDQLNYLERVEMGGGLLWPGYEPYRYCQKFKKIESSV